MKRRKAIGGILLAGAGVATAGAGYEWFSLHRRPDQEWLLSKSQLLTDIAETIIPATDTPGAREAGAIHFLIPLLTECTDRRTLNRFISGLKELESYTESTYHRDFAACSTAEKEAVLTYLEKNSGATDSILNKVKRRYVGSDFIDTMKHYTVQSYCISEKGATLGLAYVPVPGKYMGCIPLTPHQRAWATK